MAPRSRLAGAGFKPPRSHGDQESRWEAFGEKARMTCQVRAAETSESEPFEEASKA